MVICYSHSNDVDIVLMHVNVDSLFQAKHAYEAQQDDELNLKPGDTLRVLNADNNDWWTVEDISTGKQGLVPSNVCIRL